MKNVFVSIVNFNGRKNTLECLESINKSDAKHLNVILINNSPEEKLLIDHAEYPNVRIYEIENSENEGFSGGHNKGIEFALKHGAEYIAILNNDVLVDEHMFSELLGSMYEEEKIGVISPKIYFAKGHEFHKKRYKKEDLGNVIWYAGGIMDWDNVIGSHRGVDALDEGQYDKIEETEFATGACMMIKSSVIRRVGFFNPRYFLYYEDLDFNMRVKKNGYKVFYTPRAFLWHKNAGSSGGSGSVLQDYYITRNRLLFGMRYAPIRSKIALIVESFQIAAKGRKWQKQGVRDFYLGVLGKGSYV